VALGPSTVPVHLKGELTVASVRFTAFDRSFSSEWTGVCKSRLEKRGVSYGQIISFSSHSDEANFTPMILWMAETRKGHSSIRAAEVALLLGLWDLKLLEPVERQSLVGHSCLPVPAVTMLDCGTKVGLEPTEVRGQRRNVKVASGKPGKDWEPKP
jgi:hypothetical protein